MANTDENGVQEQIGQITVDGQSQTNPNPCLSAANAAEATQLLTNYCISNIGDGNPLGFINQSQATNLTDPNLSVLQTLLTSGCTLANSGIIQASPYGPPSNNNGTGSQNGAIGPNDFNLVWECTGYSYGCSGDSI